MLINEKYFHFGMDSRLIGKISTGELAVSTTRVYGRIGTDIPELSMAALREFTASNGHGPQTAIHPIHRDKSLVLNKRPYDARHGIGVSYFVGARPVDEHTDLTYVAVPGEDREYIQKRFESAGIDLKKIKIYFE